MPEKQRYNWRTPLSSVTAFNAFDLTSTFIQIKKIKTNRRGVQTKSGGENWGGAGGDVRLTLKGNSTWKVFVNERIDHKLSGKLSKIFVFKALV